MRHCVSFRNGFLNIHNMQTFLVSKSFQRSAQALDSKRLNKQVIEVAQILNAMYKENTGWRNHPITKMWRNYHVALAEYGMTMEKERLNRGMNPHKSTIVIKRYLKGKKYYPSWINSRKLHLSHKSNLLRKDKEYYSNYFKNIPDNLPYIWFQK